jgi:hypothetical protein
VYLSRKAVAVHPDGGYQVESQKSEVRQVVPVERFAPEVGVDQAQTPEKPLSKGIIFEVREKDTPGVADYDVADLSAPFNEEPDLAIDRRGEGGEGTGRFGGDYLVAADPAPVEPF